MLLEFALSFPLLLLVLFGIVDFGFLFHEYLVTTNAAREGARLAARPGYTTADVQDWVTEYVNAGLGAGAPPVTTVEFMPHNPGTGPAFNFARVTVQASRQMVFLGPISAVFGGSIGTVSWEAVSLMRVEVAGSPP